jgi:hypothetical protein
MRINALPVLFLFKKRQAETESWKCFFHGIFFPCQKKEGTPQAVLEKKTKARSMLIIQCYQRFLTRILFGNLWNLLPGLTQNPKLDSQKEVGAESKIRSPKFRKTTLTYHQFIIWTPLPHPLLFSFLTES